MMHSSHFDPYKPTDASPQAIARREMMLPPDVQMYGHMQELRDALLAVMLLGDGPFVKLHGEGLELLERMRLRNNEKAKMQRRVTFLKSHASEETIEKCRVAAVKLYKIAVEHQHLSQPAKLTKDGKPISDRAYRDAWNQKRKERESRRHDPSGE